MRRTSLLILAILTVIAATAAIAPPAIEMRSTRAPTANEFVALKEAVKNAQRIVVTSSSGTLTLDQKPEGWALADKGDYPIPEATIQPLLDALASLRGVTPKTAIPSLYPRLDLGDPGPRSNARSIAFQDAKAAALATIIIGKPATERENGGRGGIYVRMSDSAQTWRAEPAFVIPQTPLDWIDRKIVDLDPVRVVRLTIAPASGKPLVMSRQKPEDKFETEGQPAAGGTEDPGADLAKSFHNVELSDVKPASDLAGATPETKTTAETFDGLSVSLVQSRQNGEDWVTVEADGAGKAADEAAEITKRTKPWAYRFAGVKTSNVSDEVNDLKQPKPPPRAPKAAAKSASKTPKK